MSSMSAAAEAMQQHHHHQQQQQQQQQEEDKTGPSSLPTILRFVHINDCYELLNLPRLATAVREVRICL
jgi:hypothetical protein